MVKPIYVISLGLFLLTNTVSFAQEAELLLDLGFDEVESQTPGAKYELVNVSKTYGKSGKGALLNKDAYIKLDQQDNLNYQKGTLEFWFQPAWEGSDQITHYFFQAYANDTNNINVIQLLKVGVGENNYLLGSITGLAVDQKSSENASVPQGRNFSATAVDSWKKGEWHQIVFTWDKDKRQLKLYIDGALRAVNTNILETAFPEALEKNIVIGANVDQTAFAEGVIDEVKIWSIPKTDWEVAQAYGVQTIDGDINPVTKPITNKSYGGVVLLLLLMILLIVFVKKLKRIKLNKL